MKILILLTSATALHAQVFDQFWPRAEVYVGTGRYSRLMFQYNGARTPNEGHADGQVGAFMDFFLASYDPLKIHRHPDTARNKAVTIRVGYILDKSPQDVPSPYTAHTALIELTPRFHLPKRMIVTDRNRGELRFQNSQFVPRYRNRLRFERTWDLDKRTLTPYVQAEAFYDTRYDAFYRLQYSAGIEFEIIKQLVIEGYYLRQQTSRPTFKSQNVVGLTAYLYFP